MNESVSSAMERRMSIRAFLDRAVDDGLVRDILDRARRSPSAGNLQPWMVHVVAGEKLVELRRLIAGKFAEHPSGEPLEFSSYPRNLWEPLRSRRHEAGRLRYEAFGYADKDQAGMNDLKRRNYAFFGAPVGLFFFLDRRVGPPQWADMGMYLMSVMLLAAERGLDTCAQQIWGNWNRTLYEFLKVPGDDFMLFCGMSLGYRDPGHPCSFARTDRAPVESFVTFHGLASGPGAVAEPDRGPPAGRPVYLDGR